MTTMKMNIDYLEMLFKQSSDMVFYMRKVGNEYIYEYINDAAANTIPNIAIGKSVTEVMNPKLSNTILKYYNEAIESMQQTQFQDYTLFTHDIRKFESTVYPILVDDKQYILSITRLIAVDRKIEDKYLFLRSVFFKTFLSTVMISNNFELLEANQTFLRDFAISIEEIRGKNIKDIGFIEPQYEKLYMSYVKQAIAGQSLTSKHIQLKDLRGEIRHFIASFSALHGEEDEVIAVIVILQETTNFVKQEEKLKTVSHAVDVLKDALSSTSDITITDVRGRIIEVNDKYLQRCGYTREELIGKTHRVLNSGFHPKEFFKDLWETIQGGNIWRGEICNCTKDGTIYWNEASIIPLRNVDGEIYQYLGVYFNVSDKKKLMTELRKIERTFRLITENTDDLIIIVNEKGYITYASPSYIRLLGIAEADLLQMCYEELLVEDSKSIWMSALANERSDQDIMELEIQLPSGETVWTEGHYKSSLNTKNETRYETTMVSRIITDRKKYENELKFMAYHDNLTQLPNRLFLQKQFPHLGETANALFKSIGIVYIDGDNFKQVNDTYGHDMGDDFIRNFGKVLARNVREDDLVIRMGGDEFVVLCTNLSQDKEKFEQQIAAFFNRVQRSLAEGWVTNGISFNPTSTMGVAMYPNDGIQLDELIDLADKMLFEAKSVERNSFKIYDGSKMNEL